MAKTTKTMAARSWATARSAGPSFAVRFWANWRMCWYWRRVCYEAAAIERSLGGPRKLARSRPARLRQLHKLAKYERRAMFGRG